MQEMFLSVPAGQPLQPVLDALPADPQLAVHIRLARGTWREKITLLRPHTTLEGEGADATLIVWQDAATDPAPDHGKRGTFRTATLRTDGEQITLCGLHIRNDAAPRERAGQAIALYADGDGFTCRDCRLSGAQDTLFTAPLPLKEMQPGGFVGPKQFALRIPQRQVYQRCRIEGDVDFIFGGAAAWFEDCDLVSIDGRGDTSAPTTGYVTAASTPEGQVYGYVFHRCRFLSEGCSPQSVYLGRPWRPHARTVLLNCFLGEHIRPEGWHDWGKEQFHTAGYYAEFGSTGTGAAGQRAAFAHQLTSEEAAAYTLSRFMETAP